WGAVRPPPSGYLIPSGLHPTASPRTPTRKPQTLRTDARPKGPGRWLPPAEAAHGTYAADWAGTKLRWKLNTEEKEHAARVKLADACPDTVVEYEVVP
ncbi:hypothetical protein ACFYP8_39615, partial [Streptomyces hirsutus]